MYKFMYVNILSDNNISDTIKREIGGLLALKLQLIGGLKVKIVRRCVFTSRSRVNYARKLRGSRMKMRELIQSGVLPGFHRAIW